jgi:CubicO group peptidase (beta-lactamase class C family)
VKITLRQLVSHVSGIRSTEDRDFKKVYNFQNATQTLTMFANEPLIAKPETKFYYSNFGWQLIGAIVESVTNQRYETLINEMFLKLGMKSTRMERRSAIIANRSRHYSARDKTQKFKLHTNDITDDLRPFPNWPCGAGLSTVPDLLTYTNVLLNSYKKEGII